MNNVKSLVDLLSENHRYYVVVAFLVCGGNPYLFLRFVKFLSNEGVCPTNDVFVGRQFCVF